MTAEPKNKPQRAFILPKDDRRIKTGKLNSSVHFNSFTVGRGAKLINQQRTSDTGSTLTKSRKSNISRLKRVLSLISFHLWAVERLWFEMQPYCRFYQTYSKNKFNISRSPWLNKFPAFLNYRSRRSESIKKRLSRSRQFEAVKVISSGHFWSYETWVARCLR